MSSTDLNTTAGDPYTAPDFAAAALITIDVQRDALDGGPLEIPGTSTAIPAIGMLLDAFRRSGRQTRPSASTSEANRSLQRSAYS